MAIDPLGSAGIPEAGARRTSDTAQIRGEVNPAAAQRPDATDTAELSIEARRLASGADIPRATLTADHLLQISQRLADGSYNTDAAIDSIAKGIREEL